MIPSQFTGERKLACRDGVDLVCRRVLLAVARERGVSNSLLIVHFCFLLASFRPLV